MAAKDKINTPFYLLFLKLSDKFASLFNKRSAMITSADYTKSKKKLVTGKQQYSPQTEVLISNSCNNKRKLNCTKETKRNINYYLHKCTSTSQNSFHLHQSLSPFFFFQLGHSHTVFVSQKKIHQFLIHFN